MLKHFKPLLSLTLAAFPAVAPATATAGSYECKFTRTCQEELGCREVDRRVTIKQTGSNQFEMVLPGKTVKARKQDDPRPGLGGPAVAFVSELDLSSLQVLTIFEDGSSVKSAHAFINAPFGDVARGTCRLVD